jgi:hypothetical protein
VQAQFLEGWNAGRPQLPNVEYPKFDYSPARAELEAVFTAADADHPVGDFLRRTAESWRIATELLEAAGTPAITQHSIRLFGRPGDRLPGGSVSNLDAAKHFIDLADELDRELVTNRAEYCIPVETLRDELQASIDAFFMHHQVRVEIDLNLIFPVERLRELVQKGVLGRLHRFGYSVMGHIENEHMRTLQEVTAVEIARRLARDGVDYVLLVPA